MTRLVLDRFLPYRLSVAANAVSTRISQSYRRQFGLKIPEWRLIAILAENDKITPQDVGKKGELDKITVSRAAMNLLERGLISQQRNPQDGRSHFLSLTAEGRDLYEKVAPAALLLEAALLETFTDAERDLLDRLLRRMEEAANSP